MYLQSTKSFIIGSLLTIFIFDLSDSEGLIKLDSFLLNYYFVFKKFFKKGPLLVWTLIASLFIGNALLLVINLPLIKMWVQVLRVPAPYLFAGILVFALVGAYTIRNSAFDLLVAVGVGLLGMLLRRFGYPITPLILGAILGPMVEGQFRTSMQLSAGDPAIFISTGFTWLTYSLIAIALLWPVIWKLIKPRISKR